MALVQDKARVPLRESGVVYASILMVAAAFCLVDWQYTRVTKKINPASAVAFAETQCMKSLAAVHGLADDVAAWLQIHNAQLTREEVFALNYTRHVAPHVAVVDRQLENLVEISLRLFSRGEPLAGQRGLAAVRNVLARYL